MISGAFVPDDAVVERLRQAVGGDETRVRPGAPLAPLTTFHVGGPAEYLVEVRSEQEIVECVRAARSLGLPVTPLGGGSNVLLNGEVVFNLVQPQPDFLL